MSMFGLVAAVVGGILVAAVLSAIWAVDPPVALGAVVVGLVVLAIAYQIGRPRRR